MDVIYRTLPNLKTENQDIISVNYKLSNLHHWMNHEGEFKKYLQSLLDGANTNILAINALIRKCGLIEGISKMYDVLPDESKEKICHDLIGKRKFFEDAYRLIMDTFKNAAGEKEDAVQE